MTKNQRPTDATTKFSTQPNQRRLLLVSAQTIVDSGVAQYTAEKRTEGLWVDRLTG